MRKNTLILQPFGAAVIDGQKGKVDFLNEIAAFIFKEHINGSSVDDIVRMICQDYNVSYEEAKKELNLEEVFRRNLSLIESDMNKILIESIIKE